MPCQVKKNSKASFDVLYLIEWSQDKSFLLIYYFSQLLFYPFIFVYLHFILVFSYKSFGYIL